MIHEGIELIVTFPNHECLINFKKILHDVSMSMAPKSFTDKNDLVRRIMINEQMKINGHPVMSLLVRKDEQLSPEDNAGFNDASHIHTDAFLSFLVLRRLDSELDTLFDTLMSTIQPKNIMFNGIEDKMYKIENSNEFDLISPYHAAVRTYNLESLLPLRGQLVVKNIWLRLNRIFCQQIKGGYYRNLYDNFARVLNTLNILDLSHNEHEVSYIHFRKSSCFNTKSSSVLNLMEMKNELCTTP